MSRQDKDEDRRYRSDGRSDQDDDPRASSNRGEAGRRDRRERSRDRRDRSRDREDRRERSLGRGDGEERRSRDYRRERSHERDRGRREQYGGRLNRDRDRNLGENVRQQDSR